MSITISVESEIYIIKIALASQVHQSKISRNMFLAVKTMHHIKAVILVLFIYLV